MNAKAETVRNFPGPSGTVRNCLGPFGTLWNSLFKALFIAIVLTGCASHRPWQEAGRVAIDTLYIHKMLHDSIYIDNRQKVYQQSDTIYLERTKYEYRYRLLRDTVYRTRIDTIPIVREVEVVREVRHLPWWARVLSWIGTATLILLLGRLTQLFITKR